MECSNFFPDAVGDLDDYSFNSSALIQSCLNKTSCFSLPVLCGACKEHPCKTSHDDCNVHLHIVHRGGCNMNLISQHGSPCMTSDLDGINLLLILCILS